MTKGVLSFKKKMNNEQTWVVCQNLGSQDIIEE